MYLKQRAGWSWMVFGVWLVGTAFAFWVLELQQQRSFETQRTARFDAGARARSSELWFRENFAARLDDAPRAATVIHVYTADCPCNRFTHPHLARIIQRYQARGVGFMAAKLTSGQHSAAPRQLLETGTSSASNGPDNLPRIVLPQSNDAMGWIEATPAALVFDSTGRLVYFGPYSDSGRCGDSGGLVEKVLDRLLAGQRSDPQPFYGGGCFCGAARGM